MVLEQIKTAIKALPTLDEREAAQIVSFLKAHFPWATTTAIVLQDCVTEFINRMAAQQARRFLEGGK